MKTVGAILSVASLLIVLVGAPIYDAVQGNWPGRHITGEVTFDEARSGKLAQRIEDDLERHSTLDELVRPRYNEATYLMLGSTQPGVTVGKDRWLFPAGRLTEPGKKNREELQRSAEFLGELFGFLESKGCIVIVQLVPRKRTLYPEMLPSSYRHRYVPLFDVVRDALLAEGLDVPDLRPVMRGDGEEILYLTNDTHWQPEGCHRAAQFITEKLLERIPLEDIPGRRLDVEVRRGDPKPFIGYQQRLLGFTEDGWLFNRFTVETREVGAYLKGGDGELLRGALSPRPVVVLGTSMSAGPYFGPSQFIATLGMQVESRAQAGYGAGYRIAELFAEILTQRRRVPRVLIWEIPEDFLAREGRYISDPLEATVALLPDAPYDAKPIEYVHRRVGGMKVVDEKDGVLRLQVNGQQGSVVYQLAEPLAGDAGAVLRFDCFLRKDGTPAGMLRVQYGNSRDPENVRTVAQTIRVSSDTHPIFVPLEMGADETVDFVRIHPYTGRAQIRLTDVELWMPSGGDAR